MEEETTIPQMVELVRARKLPRRQLIKTLTAMGVSAAGVSAIVATTATKLPAKVNAAEDAAMHLQMHDDHLTAQSQGNTSALHDDYAEHAVVEDSMFQVPLVGRAAIIARKTLGFAAITAPQITLTNRIALGHQPPAERI